MHKDNSDFLPILSTLQFPGMLYASTIRSSTARAKSVRIVRNPLPAGYFCIRPEDIVAENCSLFFADDIPLFAHNEISYAGEPLGLIVGPDCALCDELAQSVPI